MLYSSRDLLIQTDLPFMYLTAQYYAVSCLPSQQSASSQAVFFLLAHQTDLLPFQCQCIGKSKGSLRYSVQQGSYMNNHYVHRAWVLFNGQVNVLINLCTSFYIQFWLNLILLSDKSKTICTTVTSSIYFEVFKLFSQTKYDATYIWCINRLL